MQICKVKNYQELSRKAANLIAAQIILKPDSVLVWRPVHLLSALTTDWWKCTRTATWFFRNHHCKP